MYNDEKDHLSDSSVDKQQGFQVLAGVDDAFGGFTEGLLRDLKEEYPKASIVIYGLQSSNLPNKEVYPYNFGVALEDLTLHHLEGSTGDGGKSRH